MQEQIIKLQERIAYQQAGLDHLTDTVLQQGKQIEQLESEIKQLKAMLREAMSSNIASMSEETPPPHY